MTEEDKRDLNRRVALALGWEACKSPGGTHNGWWKLDGKIKIPPPMGFCTDPVAAALVKRNMKERGWRWNSGILNSGAFAVVDTKAPLYLIEEALEQESEEVAICLAFLAACDAIKKAEETDGQE